MTAFIKKDIPTLKRLLNLWNNSSFFRFDAVPITEKRNIYFLFRQKIKWFVAVDFPIQATFCYDIFVCFSLGETDTV